jgi:ATP-dependent RNA helicase DDX21
MIDKKKIPKKGKLEKNELETMATKKRQRDEDVDAEAARVKSSKPKKPKKSKKSKSSKPDKKKQRKASSESTSAEAESAEPIIDQVAVPESVKESVESASSSSSSVSPSKSSKKDKSKSSKKSSTNNHVQSDDVVDAEQKTKDEAAEKALIRNYDVSAESQEALEDRGIRSFFPIQAETYALLLAGRDVLGRARTGTGKTLAFALPIVERLRRADVAEAKSRERGRAPRVIVMAPTRELAKQVEEEFVSLAGALLKVMCIYGGTAYGPQLDQLRAGVDIVVGTPGRLIDHLEKGSLRLDQCEYVVMDEADKMLSDGFAEDMDRVLSSTPRDGSLQTLLFSATIPQYIKQLSERYMRPDAVTVDLVGQQRLQASDLVKHYAINCMPGQRTAVVSDIVKMYSHGGSTIVFTNTKTEANELALDSSIASDCQVLHGDIAQAQREVTLNSFRENRFPVLVATDVAARGLDIRGVALVINLHPPKCTEDYVHRSGRTGRAMRAGVAVTFYTRNEQNTLRQIERQAHLTFERIGAPQPEDLIGALGQDAAKDIADVHPSMTELFQSIADELIEEHGAKHALAAALAVMSGYTDEAKPRSLLSGMEGFTTVCVKGHKEIYSPRFVISWLEGIFNDENSQQRAVLDIKGISLCTDGGACADVPSEIVDTIVENLKNRPYERWTLEVPTTLPELKDPPPQRGGGGGGRNGGGRWGGNRNGGGGGRWGGNRNGGGGGWGGNGGNRGGNSRGGGYRNGGGGGWGTRR